MPRCISIQIDAGTATLVDALAAGASLLDGARAVVAGFDLAESLPLLLSAGVFVNLAPDHNRRDGSFGDPRGSLRLKMSRLQKNVGGLRPPKVSLARCVPYPFNPTICPSFITVTPRTIVRTGHPVTSIPSYGV